MNSEDKKKLEFILNPDKRKYKHILLAISLTILFFILALIAVPFETDLSAMFGLFIILIWLFALFFRKWPSADGDVYEVVTKKHPDGSIKKKELVKIDFTTYLSPLEFSSTNLIN